MLQKTNKPAFAMMIRSSSFIISKTFWTPRLPLKGKLRLFIKLAYHNSSQDYLRQLGTLMHDNSKDSQWESARRERYTIRGGSDLYIANHILHDLGCRASAAARFSNFMTCSLSASYFSFNAILDTVRLLRFYCEHP